MSAVIFLLLFIGLFFVGPALWVLFGVFRLIRACKETTEGVIVDFNEVVTSYDSASSTEYAPIFRYTVNENEYIQIPSNYTTRLTKSNIGVKTMIFYNPNNPEQCYAKGYNKNVFLAIPGITFLIIGFGVAVIAYRISNMIIFN